MYLNMNIKKKKRQTSDEVHIGGNDAFVIASVVVFASLSRKACAVATVVDEEEVTGFGGSDEACDSIADVFAGGLCV